MKDGQKITFHEEGDQVPGLEPGDIIIVLDQKEHPVFRRSGDDLIVKREISLADALCGCRQVIRTLDNRTLLISSPPGLGTGRALHKEPSGTGRCRGDTNIPSQVTLSDLETSSVSPMRGCPCTGVPSRRENSSYSSR